MDIESMIYEVRGKQVMLDSDLAKLYKCTNGTKDINKAVKRNIERFPEEFYFQLKEDEITNLSLRFQFGTLNSNGNKRGQHIKYLPYVFTEQGVAMLSSVLHTETAIDTSIKIINAFVAMRHLLGNNILTQKYYNDMTIRHDSEIKVLFDKLEDKKEINDVYYAGKIYDAYSKVLDIFKEAKEELIIIDRYADKQVLDMIKELNIKIILITGHKLTKLDIDKYNSTYNNLSIFHSDIFHDRFIIIDRRKIYHSGNLINHIGYRKSCIDIIEYKNFMDLLLRDVDNIINK